MALPPLLLPPQRSSAVDGSDRFVDEWYRFLSRLVQAMQAAGVDPAVIADLEARVAALEDESGLNAIVQGLLSVEVVGQLAEGFAQLSLVNDEAAPGNIRYYGTGPTGTKGWGAIADTVAGEDSIVQDVGPDGVSTFHLDGDILAPGALFGYGSNMAGVKGWYRPALFESTGLLDGGALSINAGDNTKFDVDLAIVGFTDYTTNPAAPTRAVAAYGPTLANTVPSLAVIATYVGIQTPGLALVKQSSPFTATQRRTIVPLGAVISNGTNLIAVNNLPDVMRAGINQIQDLMAAIGPMRVSGNVVSPNGANLQIDKSVGTIFKQGANFSNNEDDPHNLPLPNLTAANFNYRTSTGAQAATTNAINVTQYESPLGTLATVPNNRFTIQRISVFTSNLIRIQYGQFVYQTMAEAEASLATEAFVTEQNIADNGILLAFLIVEKSATALNNPAQAKFIPASKFGGPVGTGGTSITNTDALPEGVVNLYFTDERAQDAVGNNLLDTATVNLTYNDATGQISADVQSGVFQPLDGDLTALAALATTGFPARTAANTWAQRSFPNGTGFTWTNPAGIAGDPTLVLSTNLQAWSGVTTASKEPAISAGTTAQLWRGDKIFTNTLTGSFGVGGTFVIAGLLGAVGTLWAQTDSGTARFLNYQVGAGVTGAQFIGIRSQGTLAAPTFPASGQNLFELYGSSYNGTTQHFPSNIAIVCEEAHTTTAAGTGFYIQTTPVGSTASAVRIRINAAGNWMPGADNFSNIGSGALRMKEIFAANGAINTSDANEKDQVIPFTAAELAASADIAKEIGTYRWLKSIEEKGDDARRHVGLTVQRVIEIMQGHSLDPFRYGFICYDEWDEIPAIVEEWPDAYNDEGKLIRAAGSRVVQEMVPAGNRYGFRHDELLLFIARGQAERLERLEALLNP